MEKDNDKLFKIIEDNRKWDAKRTRIIFVLILLLFLISFHLITYILMGDKYFTDFLGK
ncbi:hypothetical protein OQZ33_07155 [Pedobacter sp. MC2016-05]|uniref:hypothetical protein n=1 Tax=Pedobacter sp. MC2016-05 TaxID=2994474 RepID=UPI002247C1BA|nr:hypothetical protein [Pedobacter sp. MC2016-05]MCX2474103.1 hypothetical protein [Pedobacter sp. MC2016-05]